MKHAMTIGLPLRKLNVLYIMYLKAKPGYFILSVNINTENLTIVYFVKIVIILAHNRAIQGITFYDISLSI